MLWINQKGFLNYKRYCFLNVFVYFFCGIEAVSEGSSTRLLRQRSPQFKSSPSISLERFDGLTYQGQVRVSKNTVPFSFCGSWWGYGRPRPREGPQVKAVECLSSRYNAELLGKDLRPNILVYWKQTGFASGLKWLSKWIADQPMNRGFDIFSINQINSHLVANGSILEIKFPLSLLTWIFFSL